ncbi:FG-GAP repeat domain-containing protein [Streptomyces sp. NPDC003952]
MMQRSVTPRTFLALSASAAAAVAVLGGAMPAVASSGAGTAAVSASAVAGKDRGSLGQGPEVPVPSALRGGVGAFALNSAQESSPRLTRSQVISRAAGWVGKGIPYNQSSSYQGYRTDCSGYASMAWELSSSLDTTSFVPRGVASWISKSALKPGDAMLNDAAGNSGHIVIFHRWTDSSQTSYLAYEFTGSGVHHRKVPYPYFAGSGTYRPVHNDSVVDDPTTPPEPPLEEEVVDLPVVQARTASGDFNGDGKADIAGIDANNNLKLYVGNGAGTVSGGTNMLGSTGLWKNFGSITAGDFNGDGRTDIAGIDANNNLKLYVGNGAGTVSGGTNMLGSTGLWKGFKGIASADFNGDGKRDIAGIDANDNAKLYVGNGAGTVSGGSNMLGSTGLWAYFRSFMAADFNNDGKVDAAGIDANDNMKLYVGNGSGTVSGGTDMLGSTGLWSGF